MNRQEFIQGLERALRGMGVSETQIREHVNYYEEYFSSGEADGRSEEEIARELGDPHLIARSITEAGQFMDSQEQEAVREEKNRSFQVHSGLGCLAAGLILLAVVSLVLTIVSGIFSLIAPILIPALFILLFVRIFSRKK